MHKVFSSVGGRTVEDNRIEYCELLERSNKITNLARQEKRNLDEPEMATVESLAVQMMSLSAEREKLEKDESRRLNAERALNGGEIEVSESLRGGGSGPRPGSMKSASGKPMVVAVGPSQRLSRSPVASGQIGEFARAIAIGANNPFATSEIRMALTSDLNSAGGYSIPDSWLSGWIDKGLEATAIAQYCTRFMMDTQSVNITTLTSRPTAATKAELAAFTESGMTFGQSRLEAFTAGSTFLASMELLQDSPNAGQQIEAACMRGLVDWLNDTMLNGTGSEEPVGVLNRDDLSGFSTPGALTWAKIADGVSALRQSLYMPNVCVVSPANYNQLHLQRELVTDDGSWLPRPEHLKDLNVVQSSHCPDTHAIIGDFTQMMFGIRENATVEVSAVADDAFVKNAVRFRLKVRCDWVPAHTAAFYLFDSIT